MGSMSRRSFLKLTGATAVAVAGTAMLSGCSVASHMEIQFDDAVVQILPDSIIEMISPELDQKLTAMNYQTKEQKIDALTRLINACLLFVPLFGTTVMSATEARTRISKALETYGPRFVEEDTIDTIELFLNSFDIKADESGNILATGNLYSTLTVTFILP